MTLLADLLQWAQAIAEQRQWLTGSVIVLLISEVVRLVHPWLATKARLNPTWTIPRYWVVALLLFVGSFMVWREPHRLLRGSQPYFSQKNARLEPVLRQGNPSAFHRFRIPLTQIKAHPAADVRGYLLILRTGLEGSQKAVLQQEIYSVNDVPEDGPLMITSDELDLQPARTDPHFVVLIVNYRDAISGVPGSQTFYFEWRGAKAETYEAGLFSPKPEDKPRIDAYIRDVLKISTLGSAGR